jgi:hypothetical protein
MIGEQGIAPFQLGFQARHGGRPLTENPFPEDTDYEFRQLWQDGWFCADATLTPDPETP